MPLSDYFLFMRFLQKQGRALDQVEPSFKLLVEEGLVEQTQESMMANTVTRPNVNVSEGNALH